MILSLSLALAAALSAPQAGGAQAPPSSQGRLSAFEKSLLRQGSGQNSTTLGGNFTVGGLGPISSANRTHIPGVWQMFLDDPGTGYQESVLLGVPPQRIFRNPPLLVMFHGADISEWDCYLNSPIFDEALNRGWYVLAPLGAHQLNFGIPYSQVNIEYALDIFTAILPVNPERIYGLGFSMGGGTMMSYAARHQDPNHARFAALINHTGGVSIANTYWNSSNTFVFDHELMFNGSPDVYPFLYSQASSLDIDFATNLVDPTTDLVRNLAHVPVLNQYATGDPLTYLINQTQVAHSWMQLIPGMEAFLLTPNQQVHNWDTIDTNTALNYLYSKTLDTPTAGQHRVLADREATWFHFYVYQDAEGAFTPFRWNCEPGSNRLTIDETENLEKIVVDVYGLGLNTAVNLELVLQTNDASTEIVTLEGYQLSPQEVLRNGVADNSWAWDSVSKTLTITESDASVATTWKIRP